ncbi:unnamed protein product [Vitrella brassicaformis CCMP3155]|uniref:Phosphoglycolate phosphatase n=1 Tax=Vitrella brassicaformis (strain CCMP3155) TaxID=1169540 RepID=A0A0G4G1Y5_VITBC|nr:unnamed protein product [Vitrella brassicaformis CCMP3155]|mmetsp:Transcript_20143/g.57607  ORF Transcript_20143/g.57607 Transcript_20143/m.57607 type:complete len:367 (+) Transcript_20143:102-1202(+)|eukprot:CEM21747.1 unnamed protein product [Vitrella brassicaformis CCMP3155]
MKFSASFLILLLASVCLTQAINLRPSSITDASAIPHTHISGGGILGRRPAAPAVMDTSGIEQGGQQGGLLTPAKLTRPQEWLDSVDVIIFDCDGVIWRGDSVIPGVPETLERLRALGKKVFFVTNNSTKSRKGYKKKFDSLGLDVKPEEIFSSSFAAAAYLEQKKFKETGKKVYVIGEVGIEEELDLIGVPWVGGTKDAGKVVELKPGYAMPVDEDVGAVVVGFDRHFNYHKIQYAQLCIAELGAEFIATNLDAVTHLTDAQEWAGNGSMVGAIKGCTKREPTVVGKPSALMIDYLAEKLGVPRQRMAMVGDRLDTDILFGQRNGLKSLLTLSGVTTLDKVNSPQNSIRPEHYVDSIADFFPQSTA